MTAPTKIAIFDHRTATIGGKRTHDLPCYHIPGLSFDVPLEDVAPGGAVSCNQGSVVVTYSFYPELDSDSAQWLRALDPDLITTDLLKYADREDGYRLIEQLRREPELQDVPIVVVSNLINSSQCGVAERACALSTKGVVGAYGTVPTYPSLDVLIGHAR